MVGMLSSISNRGIFFHERCSNFWLFWYQMTVLRREQILHNFEDRKFANFFNLEQGNFRMTLVICVKPSQTYGTVLGWSPLPANAWHIGELCGKIGLHACQSSLFCVLRFALFLARPHDSRKDQFCCHVLAENNAKPENAKQTWSTYCMLLLILDHPYTGPWVCHGIKSVLLHILHFRVRCLFFLCGFYCGYQYILQ